MTEEDEEFERIQNRVNWTKEERMNPTQMGGTRIHKYEDNKRTQPMTNLIWSFSSLKTFVQCPRKYYHIKVAKDVENSDNEYSIYGKEMHLAAEEYIRDGIDLPPRFEYLRSSLDILNNIEGEKHCEVKLGLTKTLESCEFDAPNVWWHGVADLVIINKKTGTAYSIDYKTSKNAKYADVSQLDLVACGLFAKFPEVKVVKSALLFVVSKEFVRALHLETMKGSYMDKIMPHIERLEGAFESGVWNPRQSGLCGWCPVTTCEHYVKRRQ